MLYLLARFSIIVAMKETLSFKVDPAIKDAILKLAQKENRSLSNYVVTVLMRHLEIKGIDWRKEAGEKEGVT
jgi:predicted transcriptional regulator